jgi:hypothetical protein
LVWIPKDSHPKTKKCCNEFFIVSPNNKVNKGRIGNNANTIANRVKNIPPNKNGMIQVTTQAKN